ncbi:MAG: NAD(+)/NADH kinase [Bacilli bacterium]|nr:NAD(+)/NADH kinase [Bacilli bacterium]
MKIFLVLNLSEEEKTKRSLEVVEKLSPYHELSLSITQAFELERPSLIRFDIESADLIISVGGDGTLLKAAHLAYPLHKPILGLNAGHVGALCAMKYPDLDPKDPIKDCHIEELHGLDFKAKNLSGFALNEVIVAGISRSKCVNFEIDVGAGKHLLKGDGFLVSSPAGSTAYNKSLGGPILEKTDKGFIYLPIAPVSDDLRKPTILSGRGSVVAKSLDRELSSLVIYDGIEAGSLKGEIKIRRSHYTLKLYKR